MKEIEISAKTVDEAIQMAMEQLDVSENQLEVTVLRKGKSGVFGVGAEEAVVKVVLLDQPQRKPNVAEPAKEVLETLLGIMGIEAEVSSTQVPPGESPVSLNIEGDDLGVLIGRRGQSLASLQYIVRLIVAEKIKMWPLINIDVAGYKERRYQSLHDLALRLADQVRNGRRSITLDPMPSDERRIVHLTLSDNQNIATQSTGEGTERRVVIQLKKQ